MRVATSEAGNSRLPQRLLRFPVTMRYPRDIVLHGAAERLEQEAHAERF